MSLTANSTNIYLDAESTLRWYKPSSSPPRTLSNISICICNSTSQTVTLFKFLCPSPANPPLAYFRYTLDINLTDEQVNHPLMREAEGIVAGELNIRRLRPLTCTIG